MRGRHLFFILAFFLLFYVSLNYLLFYWVDPQSGDRNGVDDEAAKQIVSTSGKGFSNAVSIKYLTTCTV